MTFEETVEYVCELVEDDTLSEHYKSLALSLKRRGQVILYGPPGTGKTYTAQKFIKMCASKTEDKHPKIWVYATRLHIENEIGWNTNSSLYKNISEGDFVLIIHISDKKKSIIGLSEVQFSKGEKYIDKNDIEYCKNHLHGIRYFKPSLDMEALVKYFDGAEQEINSVCSGVVSETSGQIKLLSPNFKNAIVSLLKENGERDKTIKLIDGIINTNIQQKICTFHPSFSYEDFIEGYKPIQSDEGLIAFRMQDGVFKEYCLEAEQNPDINYFFIIDEINRGNTAKIFGEIITLLEMDKREMVLTLPQSKSQFSIPKNMYIIATMNSADRSISSLDVALRRRFALIEIPSEPQALVNSINYEKDGNENELKLSELLEGINKRLGDEGISSNKFIGHGYFYRNGDEIEEPEDLRDVLKFEIAPILFEYCSYETDRYQEVFGYLDQLCCDLLE